MNVVTLVGRLTKEPVASNSGEMAIAKFTLAVDRMKRGEADFISCVAFNKTAELITKYITKGSQLALVGHIQTGSYADKTGNKVYTTDVIVDKIDFIGSKSTSEGSGNNKPMNDSSIADEGFMQVSDEGLPFI